MEPYFHNMRTVLAGTLIKPKLTRTPTQSQNTGASLANYLHDVNYILQVASTTTQCMCRAHETFYSAKTCLATIGTQGGKCLVCQPRFIDVVGSYNNFVSSYINSSMFCDLPIYEAILCKKWDYFRKQINMQHIHVTTINGVMQFS